MSNSAMTDHPTTIFTPARMPRYDYTPYDFEHYDTYVEAEQTHDRVWREHNAVLLRSGAQWSGNHWHIPQIGTDPEDPTPLCGQVRRQKYTSTHEGTGLFRPFRLTAYPPADEDGGGWEPNTCVLCLHEWWFMDDDERVAVRDASKELHAAYMAAVTDGGYSP